MTGSGLSLFVISRSALVSTVIVAVEVLSAAFVSLVDELATAVLSTSEPSGVDGSTVALIFTVTVTPAAIVPRLSGLENARFGVQGPRRCSTWDRSKAGSIASVSCTSSEIPTGRRYGP